MGGHTHQFLVLSTSLSDGALLVLCRCGQFGTVEVEHQTPEERQAAVQAAQPALSLGGQSSCDVAVSDCP